MSEETVSRWINEDGSECTTLLWKGRPVVTVEWPIQYRVPETMKISSETATAKQLTFHIGDTWVIKVTRDGIVSNPDVPIDDGAKAIFEALKPYIVNLKG